MSKTTKEMSEIRLETSKSQILTFRDLYDLREMKKWIDEETLNHLDLEKYIEKMRMQSLESGQPELFEQWKKENLMSFLSFQSLRQLNDKMHIKICEVCGIAFPGINKNRMYCSDLCKLRAFNKKKRKN